jgi:thiol-disulfide isomerase/thioredoxin
MTGVTSKILAAAKKIILALVLLALMSFMYKYLMRMIRPPVKNVPQIVKDFSPGDSVSFAPSLGKVIEVASDRTADAILSGTFGPAVVIFVADWCGHCRNIAPSYEAAAAESSIPFVRVRGDSAPVSSGKYGISGYPTVLGFASVGGPPRRFASQRTKEALLQFAMALRGTVEEIKPELKQVAESSQPLQPPQQGQDVRDFRPQVLSVRPSVVSVAEVGQQGHQSMQALASNVEVLESF